MKKNNLIKFFVFFVYLLSPIAINAQTLEFTVKRDGNVIGNHHFSFSKQGQKTKVDVSTNLKVKALFVTVYRYEHKREEIWENNQLVSMSSKTHNDGTDESLSVKISSLIEKDQKLELTNHKGLIQTVSKIDLPVTLWNIDITQRDRLFSALDGHFYNVKTANLGSKTLNMNNQNIAVTHYQMTGDLIRDLWYDSENQLVKVAFEKNGSLIEYIRK